MAELSSADVINFGPRTIYATGAAAAEFAGAALLIRGAIDGERAGKYLEKKLSEIKKRRN